MPLGKGWGLAVSPPSGHAHHPAQSEEPLWKERGLRISPSLGHAHHTLHLPRAGPGDRSTPRPRPSPAQTRMTASAGAEEREASAPGTVGKMQRCLFCRLSHPPMWGSVGQLRHVGSASGMWGLHPREPWPGRMRRCSLQGLGRSAEGLLRMGMVSWILHPRLGWR